MNTKLYTILGLSTLLSLGTNAQIVTTIAGNGVGSYAGDGGPAADSKLHFPSGLARDAAGNMYIADQENHAIRKISAAGVISTIAGRNDSAGYNMNDEGGPATAALLNKPAGVAVDANGNVFFSEKGNNLVRKISASGILTTIAGDTARLNKKLANSGYTGDDTIAVHTRLNIPNGVAVDDSGKVYVADQMNNRIRMIDKNGKIHTVVGNGMPGYNGDNRPTPTDVSLNMPASVTFAPNGEMYIADTYNNMIRKIDKTNGKVVTVKAYNAAHPYLSLTTMQLKFPSSVTFDGVGNMYVCDAGNYKIKRVDTSYLYHTMAGVGSIGFSGDGERADKAKFSEMRSIVSDAAGNIYIADTYNERIRYITTTVATPTVANINEEQVNIFPNPALNGNFNVTVSATPSTDINVTVLDITGRVVYNSNIAANKTNNIALNQAAGLYVVKVSVGTSTVTRKLTIN